MSFKDVVPFFEQYNLQLRVIDVFGNMIWRHDPETRNRHNKVLYCMVKGNHVYTLNHNLASLEQKMNVKPEFHVKAHSDYHVGEKQEQNYKMISHIDDLMRLVKLCLTEGMPKDKVALNLIYKGDKLVDLL